MGSAFALLAVVVVLALAFDYINGFHDTANAVATVVSTNVLPGRTAVVLAAVFNFGGAFAGVGVAKTIGKGIADPASVTQVVIAAALLGAIAWNLFTWYYGIPSSSSHALVGGIVGAVWCHRVLGGADAWDALRELLTSEGVELVLVALVLSPLCGIVGGFVLMTFLLWAVRHLRPAQVNRRFRLLQLVSASFMAFAHGSNDAQKAMGIIAMALASYAAASDPGDRLPGAPLRLPGVAPRRAVSGGRGSRALSWRGRTGSTASAGSPLRPVPPRAGRPRRPCTRTGTARAARDGRPASVRPAPA